MISDFLRGTWNGLRAVRLLGGLTTAVILWLSTSCKTSRGVVSWLPPTASEVAGKLPPIEIPVPVSPVDLRTAILTLPADALAGMSQDGRRNYLARSPGVSDPVNRRVAHSSDNPYTGIDAKSMFFLRLFEDSEGRTIAASHSARPFADNSAPSALFTRVYRLEKGGWQDVTDSALSHGIPRRAYFRFDQPGAKIGFGSYVEKNRSDGQGKYFGFGKAGRSMRWMNGAFKEDSRD
jgi:hypothetical protein